MNEFPLRPPTTDDAGPIPALKRPASSKGAMAAFALVIYVTVGSAFQMMSIGRAAQVDMSSVIFSPQLLLPSGMSLIALMLLIIGIRRPWCFYFVSCILGLLCAMLIRSAWAWSNLMSAMWHQGNASADASPLLALTIASVVLCCLFTLLFLRFAFGRPSRRYYRVTLRESAG